MLNSRPVQAAIFLRLNTQNLNPRELPAAALAQDCCDVNSHCLRESPQHGNLRVTAL